MSGPKGQEDPIEDGEAGQYWSRETSAAERVGKDAVDGNAEKCGEEIEHFEAQEADACGDEGCSVS